MRKMPKVALAATAVLALGLVFAVGSASATVYQGQFCKSAPASHSCPEADVYRAGTEISASLNGVATFSSGGSTVGQCTGSTQLMRLTKDSLGHEEGGVFEQFSFSGCEGISVTFEGGGFESMEWLSGTHNGVIKNWGFLQIHQTGITCRYLLEPSKGEELFGGNSATIVANSSNNMTRLIEGSSFLCPLHETLTGTWTVTSPSPLYVEKA